jgi:general secretion pathway protein I
MRAIQAAFKRLRALCGADSGFTLIEVLVALAILSLSLGVLLAIFSQSLDRAHRNQLDMKARLLAQSLVEGTSTSGGLALGQRHGEASDGFSWTLSVKPFGSADEQAAWRYSPVEVIALVEWRDGDRLHQSKFRTLRLVASSP